MFADDTVLFAESEMELQRVMDEFYSVCTRRKLKVNAGKSKAMVFERRAVEMVEFNTAYRISVPAVGHQVVLGRENGGNKRVFK